MEAAELGGAWEVGLVDSRYNSPAAAEAGSTVSVESTVVLPKVAVDKRLFQGVEGCIDDGVRAVSANWRIVGEVTMV